MQRGNLSGNRIEKVREISSKALFVYQKSNEITKAWYFSNKHFLAKRNLSVRCWWKNAQQIAMEKSETQHQQTLLLIALLTFSAKKRFQCTKKNGVQKKKNQQSSQWNSRFQGENPIWNNGEYWVLGDGKVCKKGNFWQVWLFKFLIHWRKLKNFKDLTFCKKNCPLTLMGSWPSGKTCKVFVFQNG